ncbi:hypothetical protein ABZ723_10300 [Streptomyces sp. NPDC006700]|uniref:hypothetical protein n=1 Tax=unclassified Streptomyces TaxID=2593676 RepID=UPI0033EB1EA1
MNSSGGQRARPNATAQTDTDEQGHHGDGPSWPDACDDGPGQWQHQHAADRDQQ